MRGGEKTMLSLNSLAVGFGALHATAGAALLAAPGACRRALDAFPRARGIGAVLAAAALAGAGWVVYTGELGRFNSYKPLLFALGPVTWGLMVWLLDDLLAPRALSGLLLLAANPVMRAARFSPSPESRIFPALMYLWVVAGMALVLSPFLFRRTVQAVWRPSWGPRALGGVLAAVGVLLFILAVRGIAPPPT